MNRYVGALLFSERCDRLVLIKRHEPDHFAHKMNSIIGPINKDEDVSSAIVRVTKSELGVNIDSWEEAVRLKTPTSIIHFFRAFSTIQSWTATDENEHVRGVNPNLLHECDVVSSLRWIVPICLDEHIRLPIEAEDRISARYKGPPNQGS